MPTRNKGIANRDRIGQKIQRIAITLRKESVLRGDVTDGGVMQDWVDEVDYWPEA